MGKDLRIGLKAYPWDCTMADEGRYPRKTSPTEVFLMRDN